MPAGKLSGGGHEQARQRPARDATPSRATTTATRPTTARCGKAEIPPARELAPPMTRAALKKRLAAIEAALHPQQVEWVVRWADEDLPDDDAPTFRLYWPEDLQNGDLSDSRPLGLSKPT